MTFNPEQIAALTADLDRSRVAQRAQAGRNLSYIEGWWAIAEANRIFGFDKWHRETVELRQLGEPRLVGDKFRVGYMAKVRIEVFTEERCIIREGCGFGSGIDKDQDQAHESALKEAETDAMKRALMTFGNPFGLALYDKTQAHVSDLRAVESRPRDAAPPDDDGRDEASGRKRAAQAKRDGDDEKIKAEIAVLDMKGLADFNADFDRLTAHLPLSWLDPVRDMLESRFLEIGGTARVAEDDAAMNEAFRNSVGPASAPPVARRNAERAAA